MRLLVVNAGSRTLKLTVLDALDRVITKANVEYRGSAFDTSLLREVLVGGDGIDGVVHRIVHGGTIYTGAVRLDAGVIEALDQLSRLAPLHQPPSLAGIRAVQAILPSIPHYGCFDTAFHVTLPPAAYTYAIPRDWTQQYGVRRFGFHGLSHAYASRIAAELLGREGSGLRVVTAHLGGGSSLAAVKGGLCVDTTMGFTPLEGLVMATRSGDVDPGLVLWLQTCSGMSAGAVSNGLERHSGLLGLAGHSDMRVVRDAAKSGDADARLALDIFIRRLRAGIAAMAASMGGIDALTFTGGVGENDVALRLETVAGLGFLGLDVDDERNTGSGDRDISTPGATVRTLVVASREDLEMARQVRELVSLS